MKFGVVVSNNEICSPSGIPHFNCTALHHHNLSAKWILNSFERVQTSAVLLVVHKSVDIICEVSSALGQTPECSSGKQYSSGGSGGQQNILRIDTVYALPTSTRK